MCRRYAWVFGVMALIGPIIGLMTSAVVTYVTPKMYESETVIEVKPLPSALLERAQMLQGFSGTQSQPLPPEIPSGQQMTPQFFATEIEKIKSRNSLIQVIDNLQLTTRWHVDKETAIQILKGMVKSQNIQGTDLMIIRVRHTDKVAARDIAHEVVHAYKDDRNKLAIQDAEEGLQKLNKAVKEQEEKVEERRKILADIIRVNGKDIIIPEEETSEDLKLQQPVNPPPDTEKTNPAENERDTTIRRALDATDYVDAKRDYLTNQQLHQNLKLKQVSAEIESKIPYHSIDIHDEARIPFTPVSPNVTLNLLIGTIGGFLLSPLLSLLVIGVMRLFAKPVVAR